MRAISLISIVLLAVLAAGCSTPPRVPIAITNEKDGFFVPVGAKIVIPAGSVWKSSDGTIKQTWKEEKTYTIEERSMAFTASYMESILLARAELLKRLAE